MKNLQSLGSLSNLGNPSGGSINYFLLDKYITTVAAGSVNGTKAEPSGQTRTVVDTNTKISIGLNVVNFATGEVVGDGLFYPSLPRIAGRTFMGVITDTTTNLRFGYGVNNTGAIGSVGVNLGPTTLNIIDNASGTQIGTLVGATAYTLAIVLRTTGGYVFIKGGAFTTWTLVWAGSTNATATLFPGMTVAGTTSVITVGNVRIPAILFLPAPTAYDTFTRANGVLGNTETTGPDSQSISAFSWTSTLGTWAISSNKAAASALSGGSAFATIDSGKADILIDAAVTRSAGVAGVVLRYADSSNYIIAYHDGTNAKLDKVIAGVTTNVKSAAATYSAGAILRVIASGSSFLLFYNNVAISTVGTISDAAVQSTTVHGVYTTDTSNSLDNFLVMPRGTSNEYGALDRF